MARVFLNAGHDRRVDSGAVNPDTGLREADVAYIISDMVAKDLRAVGYEVMEWQDDDLDAVCAASNTFGADLFVSIHCNAACGTARGTETLHNKDSVSGKRLAQLIQFQMVSAMHTTDRGLKPRPVWNDDEQRWKGNIQVLNCTDAPACLVETAFIDNVDDVKLLDNDVCRKKFADAIARGVTDYFAK